MLLMNSSLINIRLVSKRRVFSLFLFGFLLMNLLYSGLTIAAPKSNLIEFWNENDEQSLIVVDHSAWQTLLDRYLDADHPSGISRFAYANVSEPDVVLLDQYLAYLQNLDPRLLTLNQQFAYWVNLYNAKTVELVTKAVQKRQITSIRQIRSNFVWPGPWRTKSLRIVGQAVSLNDIEHGILRPIWKDHRIHYVLNCASLGCPSLMDKAMTAKNKALILLQSERDFLSHPRAVQYKDGQLRLSQIFNWYRADFANDEDTLLVYLKKHVTLKSLADGPKIKYDYDWSLNTP